MAGANPSISADTLSVRTSIRLFLDTSTTSHTKLESRKA